MDTNFSEDLKRIDDKLQDTLDVLETDSDAQLRRLRRHYNIMLIFRWLFVPRIIFGFVTDIQSILAIVLSVVTLAMIVYFLVMAFMMGM